MIGVPYGKGSVRYVVTNGDCKTVGRLNSLAKAKTVVVGMTGWVIFDTVNNCSVRHVDNKQSFELFSKHPELYPHMNKCFKLFMRFKKIGRKPIA